MPITPTPTPYNYKTHSPIIGTTVNSSYPNGIKANLPNNWNSGNKYSDYINNTVFPYLQGGVNHPPYYQGSSTIKTTINNKVTNSNLFADHPKVAKMASKAQLPSIPGSPYAKLSDLTPDDYREVTIKKGNGLEQKIGATKFVGETRLSNIDVDPNDPINRTVKFSTNYQKEDAAKKATAALTLGAVGGLTSNPTVTQLGAAAVGDAIGTTALYTSVPFLNLKRTPIITFNDFRAKRGLNPEDLIEKRLDGASALARNALQGLKGKARSAAYAAASATVGAYSLFNRETIYGFGEHDSKFALRNDFTSKSNVARIWNKNKKVWRKPRIFEDPVAKITPFRGDKVSVIDFKTSTLAGIYNWNINKGADIESLEDKAEKKGLGKFAAKVKDAIQNKLAGTEDFIKFFLTGPNLAPGIPDARDEVMVFRAIITNLTDSFNPSWTPINLIGRADPNYHYGGYSREINIDFTVYATDKDELKPIWRKLNALAGYTAPEYDGSTIGLKGPWMRITVGDLFYQQPIIINSLYYTLQDADTTWETNIEHDEANMQVPKKIQVSLGASMITDYLPQKGGKFYTLSKRFTKTSTPEAGSWNWLSDAGTNEDIKRIQEKHAKQKENQQEKAESMGGGTQVSLDGQQSSGEIIE